jgi:hypothetical protein
VTDSDRCTALDARVRELESALLTLGRVIATMQDRRDDFEAGAIKTLQIFDRVNFTVSRRLDHQWACLKRLAQTGRLNPSLAEAIGSGDTEMVIALLAHSDLGNPQ